MELTIRDWMIIVGAGLVLAVLVDAIRRIYRDRQTEIRLNAKVGKGEQWADDEFNLLSELPNGGARIVRRNDLSPAASHPDDDGAANTLLKPTPNPFDEHSTAKQNATTTAQRSEQVDITAGQPSSLPSFSALDEADGLNATNAGSAGSPDDHSVSAQEDDASPPETLDWLDSLEKPESEPEPEARLPRGIDPHVFVLNVVARQEQGFSGRDILQILLACDLRFGDMDFFHRHEESAGRGPIQFSVANMMKPGVFDIDHMDQLQTRGLMFFVTLPGPQDMLKAFDYMHETAKAVAKNLNGDVLDETRSAITRQSIDHMRQQIRELERRIALDRQS